MCGCVERHVVGIGSPSIFVQPSFTIPFVVTQVDVVDGRLGVDGLRVDDSASPREAVDQFIECCAVFGKNLRCFGGIVEMRHREVSCEGAVKG